MQISRWDSGSAFIFEGVEEIALDGLDIDDFPEIEDFPRFMRLGFYLYLPPDRLSSNMLPTDASFFGFPQGHAASLSFGGSYWEMNAAPYYTFNPIALSVEGSGTPGLAISAPAALPLFGVALLALGLVRRDRQAALV